MYEFLKILRKPNEGLEKRPDKISEGMFVKAVKASKKQSASSIFSNWNYAIYKCILGSKRMNIILINYYNLTIKHDFYPTWWLKVLDIMIEKGKGPVIGKLRIIQLIEADLQMIMGIYVNNWNKHKIKSDPRISKANYGSWPNYSIEIAILEK